MIPYPDGFELGNYQRVHPNGTYVLHSSMSEKVNVVLMDLTARDTDGKKLARPLATPMNDEVYPATNDWSLFASPNHPGKIMHYYGLSGLLKNGIFDKPIFSDSKHNKYYQSVGELPGSTKEKKRIRVTLYSDRRTKEYDLNMSKGNVVSGTPGKSGVICENIIKDPSKKLDPTIVANGKARIAILKKKINSLYREVNLEDDLDKTQEMERQIDVLQNEKDEIQRTVIDPEILGTISAPVLSPNGMEIAFNFEKRVDGKMTPPVQQIYKINSDYSCDFMEDLGYETGKVQFSYPQNGKKGSLVFQGSATIEGKKFVNAIVVHDRDQNKTRMLFSGQGSIGYPGFTKDGRVIFPTCAETSEMSTAREDDGDAADLHADHSSLRQAERDSYSIDDNNGGPINDTNRTTKKGPDGIAPPKTSPAFPILNSDGVVISENQNESDPTEKVKGKMVTDRLVPLEARSFWGIGPFGNGGFGGLGSLQIQSKVLKRNVKLKCGAVIIDPNQINDDGTINETPLSCISKSGKLISKSGRSGQNLKVKPAEKAVK